MTKPTKAVLVILEVGLGIVGTFLFLTFKSFEPCLIYATADSLGFTGEEIADNNILTVSA